MILDLVAPGGPSTYTADSFRAAMSVQYVVWAIGVVQIVRFRRLVRRDLRENNPEVYAALRAGETQLPT